MASQVVRGYRARDASIYIFRDSDTMASMGLYDGLKDAASVLKEAGKIEQYRQILEVQEKLLEMQKRISELETENKELHGQLETQARLVAKDNMYWMENGDGPFCTGCWDSEHKLVRLHINKTFDSAECPKCKTRARPGKAIVVHNHDAWRDSNR
jgi:hypothetical protein